jgi:uncharacterized protein HemX
MMDFAKRWPLIGAGLAVVAVIGWGAFGFATLSSSKRATALTAQRDAAVSDLQKLQEAAGQLSQVEAKIGSARLEYSRAVQGLADVRGRIGAAQQELASVSKRAEPATDRVSQTGSIRQPEPPKRPAR